MLINVSSVLSRRHQFDWIESEKEEKVPRQEGVDTCPEVKWNRVRHMTGHLFIVWACAGRLPIPGERARESRGTTMARDAAEK